ncbi:MAG: XrtA/PEP-CTERM system histidine kinase PrsK [Limisphaerales bacterium]
MSTEFYSTWVWLGTYISYLAGVLAVLLGFGAWVRDRRSASHAFFALGMVILGVEAFFVAQGMRLPSFESRVHWQKLRMISLAVTPAIWLAFTLSYSRGNPGAYLRRWGWLLGGLGVLPVFLVLLADDRIFLLIQLQDNPSEVLMGLGRTGRLLQIMVVGGFVLSLMNLERTFRAAVGTMRWRIKFVIVGLAVLFVARIYSSSQALVFNLVDFRFQVINSSALLVAVALMGISFLRTHVFAVEVYPSQVVLRSSLTAVLAGAYLLVAGILAKSVGSLGGFPLQAFVVMVAIAVLALLLMSDRFRSASGQFVSRHFRRPSYDYREIWRTFTGRIGSQATVKGLGETVIRWFSETFEILSATFLVLDQEGHRLECAASTLVRRGDGRDLVFSEEDLAALERWAKGKPGVADLESLGERWAHDLRATLPTEFKGKGGRRHLLALVADGQVLGLVVLGDRVRGRGFSHEDCELLECLADQVAAVLLTVRLSERSVQAREMETLQTMSTFFAHDLKNTASTLSLMLQNLPKHYDKPEFREDALKGLERCVGRINSLVGQLAVLRRGLELHLGDTDFNAMVSSALLPLEAGVGGRIQRLLGDSAVLSFDSEQLQKVVSNLVLNALEASAPAGEVVVSTSREDGWVRLEVADSGVGMSREFMEKRLFRPFQTTKKKGIGIGLFHSKAIVEAHGGRVEVASEEGKGTRFTVSFRIGG